MDDSGRLRCGRKVFEVRVEVVVAAESAKNRAGRRLSRLRPDRAPGGRRSRL